MRRPEVALLGALAVLGCAPEVSTHSAPPLRTVARTIGYHLGVALRADAGILHFERLR
jgi:hypothetical protein